MLLPFRARARVQVCAPRADGATRCAAPLPPPANNQTLLKDYIAKKSKGALLLDKYNARMGRALTPVPLLRQGEEGSVSFGDVAVLAHSGTGASVAFDVEDKDPRLDEETFAVSGAAGGAAMAVARNTFMLVDPAGKQGAPVRYGEPVLFRANPAAMGVAPEDMEDAPGLYLRSWPLSTTAFSKLSRRQEVALTSTKSYSCQWVVQPKVGSMAKLLAGQAVKAGDDVVLVHAATKQNLCITGKSFATDFGPELEACAFTTQLNNKSGALEQMAMGKPDALIEKTAISQNFFQICNA